jgi:short-subunit dehydrogenase
MQKSILIAGAGKGIGFELAKLLSTDENNSVFAVSRNISQLDKLANEINSKTDSPALINLALDFTASNFPNVLEQSLEEYNFKPNVVIYNAGLLINKPFAELTNSDFDQLFDINVKSAFRLFRMLLPRLDSGSHLLGISSMGGFQGSLKFPGLSLYSASKAALAVLMECLAEELKDRQIKANALALGSAQTEMLAQAFLGYKAPLSAKEMAVFVADFALNGSRYFNGKILPVSVSTP